MAERTIGTQARDTGRLTAKDLVFCAAFGVLVFFITMGFAMVCSFDYRTCWSAHAASSLITGMAWMYIVQRVPKRGAMIAMGAIKQGLAEDELPDIVQRWRSANLRIKDYWYAVDGAATSVMQDARPVGIDHGIIFARECNLLYGYDYLTIQLPSGRKLYYPQPYLADNQFGRPAIHYRTQVGSKWANTSTYGGKLVENITQAVARDCLALAVKRLTDAGYAVLMHIHDEIVIEIAAKDLHDDEIDHINKIMCESIPWAPGLLLSAAGFVNKYYTKD